LAGLAFWCLAFSPSVRADNGIHAYERGELALALKKFTERALMGDASAQNNLAVMYANGEVVKRDMKTAARWYTAAAEQGLSIAQYNLGVLHEEGLGVDRDPAAAAVWYQLAAIQGDVLAQYRLGLLLADGGSGVGDDAEAYFWLSVVAGETDDKVVHREALAKRAEVAARLTRKQIVDAEFQLGAWRSRH